MSLKSLWLFCSVRKWAVKGGNATLDQVSLCTLGRLNNMAPRLRAPCSVGPQSSSRSLSSHISLSLIILWSSCALTCPLLYMTRWSVQATPPTTPPPPLWNTVSNIRCSALISSGYVGMLLQSVVAGVCSRPSVQACVFPEGAFDTSVVKRHRIVNQEVFLIHVQPNPHSKWSNKLLFIILNKQYKLCQF